MSMTSEMEGILAAVADEFAQAEVYNDWRPPDGEYTVVVVSYSDGVSTRGNNKYAWWALGGRLLCPGTELDEKEFTIGPFRSTGVGFLKAAMSVLAGEKTKDINQAEPILSAAVGKVVNVRVRTTENDRGTFTNTSITAVVEDAPTETK